MHWTSTFAVIALGWSLALSGCEALGPLGGADTDAGQTGDAAHGDDGPIVYRPEARVGGANQDGHGFVDWSSAPRPPPMLMGPQGGQHIWVSVRARGVHDKKMRVGIEMYEIDTDAMVKPGRIEFTVSFKPADDGWFQYEGAPAFVKEPCKIRDKPIRVQVDLSDLYGVKAYDQAVIRPSWAGFCP